MKKYISNKVILNILGICLLAIIWQVLAVFIGQKTFILPSPILTIKELIKMLANSYIYRCIYQTFIRMIIGFVLAFVIAFIMGVIAGNNEYLYEILKPTMTTFKAIPTACLVYLFLVIVGARITPLVIVILVSLPIIYESVVGGIKATPISLLKAAKIDGANNLKINIMIRIPFALPYIMVGISSSFGLALKIEIMAEVITGYTRLGLGSAILAAQRSDPTNMVPVFAYGLVTVILVLICDGVSNHIKTKYQNSIL